MVSNTAGPVEDPGGVEAPTRRRAAVLGSPIRHSLSPLLHTAAYAALGLTGWHYGAVECDEPNLPAFLKRLGPEWVGLSLTMPLKRVALQVADEISPLSRAVGAANTLLLGPAGHPWRAENTDVAGIRTALREAGLQRVETAVILGAGGTAQATLAALRDLGATQPVVLVRDPTRAAALYAAAERLGVHPTVQGGLPHTDLPEAEVIISTLPPGAADPLAAQRWVGRPVVLDVVYSPWPTRLAAAARAAGCRAVGGTAVLLHQAAAQVELMTGHAAPLEAMRRALDNATGRSDPLAYSGR